MQALGRSMRNLFKSKTELAAEQSKKAQDMQEAVRVEYEKQIREAERLHSYAQTRLQAAIFRDPRPTKEKRDLSKECEGYKTTIKSVQGKLAMLSADSNALTDMVQNDAFIASKKEVLEAARMHSEASGLTRKDKENIIDDITELRESNYDLNDMLSHDYADELYGSDSEDEDEEAWQERIMRASGLNERQPQQEEHVGGYDLPSVQATDGHQQAQARPTNTTVDAGL
jgi:hypothetical protein